MKSLTQLSRDADIGLLLLRLGIGVVFVAFGIDKFIDPMGWANWVPSWMWTLVPLSQTAFMYVTGAAEVALGALVLLGFWTRAAAAVSALHLVVVIASVGLNEIATRDIGLLFLALGIAVLGGGKFSLDARK